MAAPALASPTLKLLRERGWSPHTPESSATEWSVAAQRDDLFAQVCWHPLPTSVEQELWLVNPGAEVKGTMGLGVSVDAVGVARTLQQQLGGLGRGSLPTALAAEGWQVRSGKATLAKPLVATLGDLRAELTVVDAATLGRAGAPAVVNARVHDDRARRVLADALWSMWRPVP